MIQRKKRVGPNSYPVHRALIGQERTSICGVEYCEPYGPYRLGHTTTYDWRKITCRKCLKERKHYERNK